MAAGELTFDQIHAYFRENGHKVLNGAIVRHFKSYLNDPALKDVNRVKFKEYVNTLAHTRIENDQKVLVLRSKYLTPLYPPSPTLGYSSPSSSTPVSRQPPPYRPPPPVSSPISSDRTPLGSIDNVSLSSLQGATPTAPPRRRDIDRQKSVESLDSSSKKSTDSFGSSRALSSSQKSMDSIGSSSLRSENDFTPKRGEDDEMQISVKERTQKFNRMASREDEISPKPRSAEKDRSRLKGMHSGEDSSTLQPIEPKKCTEWYVTASKGDFQELMRLAKAEPRLVNKKDPFTAYTVLHWGAKYGNAEIIKVFAGTYKVDVNCKTNGGYTPLHISAQFGHKDLFKLLIEVYKADTKIRDYSGKTAEHYLLAKEAKESTGITLRKLKGRKKQSEKDLGFLRIGSLNVRVKKTTEAFSNFLGVTSSTSIPDTSSEKVHKGWGSADNVNKDGVMGAPKGHSRRKSKRLHDSGLSSTPSTPKTPTKSFHSLNSVNNDSDSDTAAGFDSNWKN